MVPGCWPWDSNPHELSLNSLRICCVYQFRHASTNRVGGLWQARSIEKGQFTRAPVPQHYDSVGVLGCVIFLMQLLILLLPKAPRAPLHRATSFARP